MATFSKASFNVASYASSRPKYPRSLYDFIFDFHKRSSRSSGKSARWDRAVDLGCGTGQATVELTPFKHVIGVDPSETMVRVAREGLEAHRTQPSSPLDNSNDKTYETNTTPEPQIIEFVQSSAENLGFLENDSVDLVIAAQACHWFDWSKVWPEVGRVLRKGGSAAFWIYTEPRFPAYPHLTPLIEHYDKHTEDPSTSVGRYWQQPGRSILSNHLLDVPEPSREILEPLERVYFTGPYFPSLPPSHTRPIIMRETMRWVDFLGYLRTWSALQTLKEHHPEDSLHPEGPLEVRFWNSLRRAAVQGSSGGNEGEEGDRGDHRGAHQNDVTMVDPESEVEVDRGVVLLLTRKVTEAWNSSGLLQF
ncbi:S-adenosyl-L-methionine-dependent methyltransferase [Scleroderma yunnanense]